MAEASGGECDGVKRVFWKGWLYVVQEETNKHRRNGYSLIQFMCSWVFERQIRGDGGAGSDRGYREGDSRCLHREQTVRERESD